MKKKYFRNYWQEYKECPDEFFQEMLFDDFMDFKIAGWELPSNIHCIIRATNKKSYKVTEYVYQRQSSALNRVKQLAKDPNIEFTVCRHDNIISASRPGDER